MNKIFKIFKVFQDQILLNTAPGVWHVVADIVENEKRLGNALFLLSELPLLFLLSMHTHTQEHTAWNTPDINYIDFESCTHLKWKKKVNLIEDDWIDCRLWYQWHLKLLLWFSTSQAKALHHAQEIIISLNTSGISLPEKRYASKLKSSEKSNKDN